MARAKGLARAAGAPTAVLDRAPWLTSVARDEVSSARAKRLARAAGAPIAVLDRAPWSASFAREEGNTARSEGLARAAAPFAIVLAGGGLGTFADS
ncbi:MAG TPA: hypothetical protein VII20_07125 [Roseiarcus sp.]